MPIRVLPEGGHQHPDAYTPDQWQRQHLLRLPPRSLDSGEFLDLLWRFKHPRWVTIDVASSDTLNRTRRLRGIAPGGTVWVADAQSKEWTNCVVPKGCLPYSSIRGAWTEDRANFIQGEHLVKGWRSALEQLLQTGFLRPSHQLSYYIGRDSWLECPPQFRL